MSASKFGHFQRLVMIFGVCVLTGSRADGAGANPAQAPRAQAQARAARIAAEAQAETLVFEIYQDRSKEHRWRLKAINGQIIATSGQGYKDKRDTKNAIDRIKADAATKLKFETYADAAKENRWRLKAANGQIIATSGQGYKNKRDCEHAIDVIKKGAEQARVEE
jgi:uncharacterized protein YegP (UPF0339 family)